ncbi:MAG: ABC transporter permease [Saprospiraceae bacterium]|nr:ABC transporter permease [Candidatus Vicinibacter affinis]
MNPTTFIAIKYLIKKKSSQAIHLITGISVLGLAVGTAALIIVLSVFNGFENLLSGLFSKHNPDIKIVSASGKAFDEKLLNINEIASLPEIKYLAKTLDQTCMLQYDKAQDFGIIKGVDSNFVHVSLLDSALVEGELKFSSEPNFTWIGLGLANKLGVSLSNVMTDLFVFTPNGDQVKNEFSQEQFSRHALRPTAVFSLHQDADYEYLFADLDMLQKLINAPDLLSAIEIKIHPQIDIKSLIPKIQQICGSDFIVKDRYKQDEAFLKIMNLEKWLFFLLFSLTLILVSFTIVGTLWMIVLEKRKDISILKSLGMTNHQIKKIFLLVGLGIGLIGLILGFFVAMLFYILQMNYALIRVPDEFIIDAYPIALRPEDFLLVSFTVLSIVFLASLLPTAKIKEIEAVFREE